MSDSEQAKIELDRAALAAVQDKPLNKRLLTYFKLSGPGWLQSAITLGGLSLATGLSLGITGGYQMLWLQPLSMVLGIIMLGTIAYVTLSTGKSPFHQINQHISPVLGWGWLTATVMANCLWTMPQFSLAWASLDQAVIPAVPDAGVGKVVIIALIALACVSVVMLYDRPGLGVRVFETLLKVMVGVIVLCFVGAVVMLAVYGQLDGGQVIGGFLPSFSSFTSPATTYEPFLAEVAAEHRGFWEGIIVGAQQDKIIAAAAVAVGVNMTFLLPYSMLRKGWGKNFRGLATFDMSTGLLIPFVIATSCIVIAATAQFHTHPAPGLMGELDEQGQVVQPSPGELADYTRKVDARLQDELGAEAWSAMSEAEQQAARAALPEAERLMAAMLVERKFGDLSRSLAPFTGDRPAELIFGLGVLAMAISTAIILMLINGLAFCVAFNRPYTSWTHRIGAIIPAITGAFGPFYWGQLTAATDVATITAAVGMILLPVAYITFILLINNRKVMGEDKPAGGKAALLNAVLIFTVTLVSIGAVRELWKKLEWGGIALMIGFLLVAALWPVVFGRKERPEGEKLAVE